MKRFDRYVCAVAGSMLFTQAALSSEWQIIEASYVPMAYPVAAYGFVCSAYDVSVCANVSSFYKFNKQTLQRVTLVGAFVNQWGVRIALTAGAQAEKLVVDPRLQVGLIHTQTLAEGRSLSGEIYASVGGDMKHRPCLDAYDREYFCGSLTAWSDYPAKRISFPEYGFKVHYRY